MTYFHTGICTIIGAKAFHGPVRDGKGWFHLAMVVRQRGLAARIGAVEELLSTFSCRGLPALRADWRDLELMSIGVDLRLLRVAGNQI